MLYCTYTKYYGTLQHTKFIIEGLRRYNFGEICPAFVLQAFLFIWTETRAEESTTMVVYMYVCMSVVS